MRPAFVAPRLSARIVARMRTRPLEFLRGSPDFAKAAVIAWVPELSLYSDEPLSRARQVRVSAGHQCGRPAEGQVGSCVQFPSTV